MNGWCALHLSTPGLARRSSEEEQGPQCRKNFRRSQHRCYEALWREYFRDPTQWWDNRGSRVSSSYPDFKHKVTKQPLWIDSFGNPPWVLTELRRRAMAPNAHTDTHVQLPLSSAAASSFVASLKICAKSKDLRTGSQLHHDILTHGLLDQCSDSLIIMYAKCGALAKAQTLLDLQKCSDPFSWGALILGYVQQGQGKQALICFERMQHEGLSPNAVTFASVLKACGSIGALGVGEQIHNEITSQGLLRGDVVLGNALVDMYAKCGTLAKARQVLEELPSRNVNSWTALISGYSQQGLGQDALSCYERMKKEGLSPDALTYSSILKACGSIGALNKGEQIHHEISGRRLLGSNIVLGTALVDMYAKCGALAKAQQVFEELPFRDVITWSALITGYTQQGQGEQALICFNRMHHEGISPTDVTYSCILKACGCTGDTKKGEEIHEEISRKGLLRKNIVLGTALVDMYAKCGAMSKAQKVLEELPSRDAFAWSALIAGYAQQGQGEHALKCFERMKREGHSPDSVTFSSVLSACSHLGLVDDAHKYFMDISTKYGVEPALENYACMVDLFGRAGHLDKAVRVIQEMPSSDYSSIWSALLGACQNWGDASVGRWAFDQAVQVDRSDASAYVLMANIYAAAGMKGDAKIIEEMRVEMEYGKT